MFELSHSYQELKKHYRVAKILHSKNKNGNQLDDHKILKKLIKLKILIRKNGSISQTIR